MRILTRKEQIRLVKYIAFDVLMSALDIAFLGGLLFVVNFYTQSHNQVGTAFLPAALANKQSFALAGIFLLAFCMKNGLGYLNTRQHKHFFLSIASRLSLKNLKDYLHGDYCSFVETDSSAQIRKISHQPIEFSNYILINLQQIITQSLLIAFTLIGVLVYQPLLFALLLLLLLPPVALLARYSRKKMAHVRKDIKTASQKAIQYLQETLAGFIESNIYHKSDFFTGRYHTHQMRLNNNIAAQQSMQALTSRSVEVFAIFGFFIMVAASLLGAHNVQIITIGVFVAAAYKIIPGIVNIMNSAGQIKTYAFTIDDLTPAEQAFRPENNYEPNQRIRSIDIEGLTFQHKKIKLLDNLSMSLCPGQLTGISGASGKGKTTLINLVLGLLEPQAGTIRFNNKTVDQYQRHRYWSNISYVKQEPFLINDTLLKNITLSDEAPDEGRLAKAMAFCGLDKTIMQFTEGLNKHITENGRNISGGQQQRVVLARALYHNFDVLILDEALSELDALSERSILIKLKQLARKGKIILLITHNKDALALCDSIVSLDEVYA